MTALLGEVGGGDGEVSCTTASGSRSLEGLHERRVDLDAGGHLLRVPEHQPLELREERARPEVGERLELLPGDADPARGGPVVGDAVEPAVELGGADIGQVAELEVERALAELRVPGDERRHRPRVVCHEPIEVQHAPARFWSASQTDWTSA
jgi:hypothetical protein